MPIGKNAIKRISKNGYSNVKTEAPDMENSVVVEEKKAEVKKPETKKTAPQPKKSPVKKTVPKKAPIKKSMESEPTFSPVETAKKVTKKPEERNARQGQGYINIGGELPIYLL